MLPTTRLRIANALVVLAIVLLAMSLYGMLQVPRPSWSRGLAIPALVIAVAASIMRRGARRTT